MKGKKPLISVITVVFNGILQIEDTIKAIINQNYKNFEYIIIDGGSIDGTVEIIKKYEPSISKWISEPDYGLYDAMNKGLKIAKGKYVWFINAGDKPYLENTFQIVADLALDNPDIIYGETIIIDSSGNEIGSRRLRPGPSLNWRSLKDGLVVCHQAIIIKKEITGNYNINYKIASDYDWIIRALKKAGNIVYANAVLIYFLDGGINKKNMAKALGERFKIMVKNFGYIPVLLYHVKFAARVLFFYLKHKRI